MKKYWFLVLTLLSVSSAQAQRYQPNSVDLRASYCIAMHQHIIDMNSAFVKDKNNLNLVGEEGIHLSKSIIATSENDLSRLKAYLLPRTKFLDSEGLILSFEQHSKDRKINDNCVNACPDSDCMFSCSKNHGYFERISRCTDLNWIPF